MTTVTTTKSTAEKKKPKYVLIAENLERYETWLKCHDYSIKDIATAFGVSYSTARRAFDFSRIDRPSNPIDNDDAAYDGSQWPLIQSFVLRQPEYSADYLDDLALGASGEFSEMGVVGLRPSVQAIVEAARSRRVGWVLDLPRADAAPFVGKGLVNHA